MPGPLAHLTWEHIGEGIIIGLGAAATIAFARFLSRTQRRIRREHLQLLRWARRAGWKIGMHFPLRSDEPWEDEDYDPDEGVQ